MDLAAELIENAALLISLTVIYFIFANIRRQRPMLYNTITGIWFGLVAVAGMMKPCVFEPGIFFDGRTIVMALAGLFGGPFPAAISVLISAVYRLMIGGNGVTAGIASIVTAAIIGLVFRIIAHKSPEKLSIPHLFVFGIVVHVSMLACQLLLPLPYGPEVIQSIWLPVLVVLPLALVLMSLFLKRIEKQFVNESMLIEAELFYRTTFYSTNDALITTTNEGKIKRMNKVAEQLTGWKEKDSKGIFLNRVFKVIDRDMPVDVKDISRGVLNLGKTHEINIAMMVKSRNGTLTHISGSFNPLRDKNGKTLGMVVAFRDQSDFWMSRKTLQESEEQFRSMFENHHVVKLVLEPESGTIVNANKAASAFYGIQTTDLIGMKYDQLSSSGWEEVSETIKDKLESGSLHTEYRHKHSDGHFMDVDLHFSRIFLKGKPYYYLIVHDVTQEKQFYKELVMAKEQAEESDRLKSAFIANMSHEIRTPLNGILGFVELLTLEPDMEEEQRLEYSGIINKSAESLLRIINDILDISKLDANTGMIMSSEFNVSETLQSIKTLYDKKIAEMADKQVDVELLCPADSLTICGDESRLIQVFTNLMDNAVKFTDDGCIRFGIEKVTSGAIHFMVSDTGIGIKKERQALVFDRFYQAHDNNVTLYGGTGLGLSIVKKLIELMEGEITISSEYKKGTQFKFVLPFVSNNRNEWDKTIGKQVNVA